MRPERRGVWWYSRKKKRKAKVREREERKGSRLMALQITSKFVSPPSPQHHGRKTKKEGLFPVWTKKRREEEGVSLPLYVRYIAPGWVTVAFFSWKRKEETFPSHFCHSSPQQQRRQTRRNGSRRKKTGGKGRIKIAATANCQQHATPTNPFSLSLFPHNSYSYEKKKRIVLNFY